MAMGEDCWAHRHRELVPMEVHHVWPVGEDGPNIKSNRIRVCSNAHSATHDYLKRLLALSPYTGPRDDVAVPVVPWRVRVRYGRKVRRLAECGFVAIHTRRLVTP